MESTDILIIGSGIAGLTLAVKAARQYPDLAVTVVSKDKFDESNTAYAQGGIAVAIDQTGDSLQRHIEDTLRAGAGLCDRIVVEKVVSEGPQRLAELQQWGIDFDHDPSGNLSLGQEGGHTAKRIIHHKDSTGRWISDGLIGVLKSLKNVRCLPFTFATDLILTEEAGKQRCQGVTALDLTGRVIRAIEARMTVLATGGVGQIFQTTTNPLIATGDGIAMAARAGAQVSDMEFVQFHPTAFYSDNENPSFLISEAVRGFGAYLRGSSGERFVFNYDIRGEMASRDVVSKAIYAEIVSTGDPSVFLDCRHLPSQELKEHFPTIYSRCLQKGIDITADPIPVTPAAHYLCGGIDVDVHGRTSIPGLYACGECARTGLHGANRLASNSLLEALVYAHAIFNDISSHRGPRPVRESVVPAIVCDVPADQNQIEWQKRYLRQLMSRNAGIVRRTKSMENALQQLEYLLVRVNGMMKQAALSLSLYELRNMVEVSRMIVQQSLRRRENCGTFFNADLEQ